MHYVTKVIQKIWNSGGWAPLTVFIAHEILSHVFNAYEAWPQLDIPFHFGGGLAMAFFISRCFQGLPREQMNRSRTVLLELILVGSLTATAAVFWEFGEFGADQLFGTNIQVSLANTMQDVALGLAGAVSFIVFRARQLRAGRAEVIELTLDWLDYRDVHSKLR